MRNKSVKALIHHSVQAEYKLSTVVDNLLNNFSGTRISAVLYTVYVQKQQIIH